MSLAAEGHAVLALALGLLALSASLLHLGRPQYAFRALIGLRHSWLSREILAFSMFAGLATLYSASLWFLPSGIARLFALSAWLENLMVLIGSVAVYCSVMIYVATRRDFWSFGNTAGRFLLSTTLLGACTLWVTTSIFGSSASESAELAGRGLQRMLCLAIVPIAIVKLLLEASLFRWLWSPSTSAWKRSAQLHVGPLSEVTLARFACGILGGVILPSIAWNQSPTSSEPLARAIVLAAAATALLAGELLERYLFFAAAAAPRMPGAIRT
jgi:DMSO reductase anchor subunit